MCPTIDAFHANRLQYKQNPVDGFTISNIALERQGLHIFFKTEYTQF